MSGSKTYHAAIEVKGIASHHLRRITDIRRAVEESDEPELLGLFNESEAVCQRLYALAVELADKERPVMVVPEYVDRGIDDFLDGAGCGCDDDCSGGCGGCGGGCGP